MPELPDIVVYLDCLRPRIGGQVLERVRLANPFLLRSVEPPLADAAGRRVTGLRRLGKRIVLALEPDLFLVLHLMIAGRLHWKPHGARPPGKVGLAAFDFPTGTLVLTEAGSKRRASLYLVRGEAELARHDPGGLEVLDADADQFRAALRRENHTLKRALTDPRLFSGIGNAYSDEILHRARLSPLALTQRLADADADRLFRAARETLCDWLDRQRREAGDGWPAKVTAVRPRRGGARPLRPALPGLRHGGAAHRLRRERDELLPALPDRRQAARRPLAVAAAQGRLAAVDRGVGGIAGLIPVRPGRAGDRSP
jgi:formamidopyrimidine-DNA glycosylase